MTGSRRRSAIGAAGNDGTVLVDLFDGVTSSAMAIDMGSGQTVWTQPDFWAIGATDDGAIGQNSVTGLWEVRTPSGSVSESTALPLTAQPVGGRWWIGESSTGVEAYLGLALRLASRSPTPWILAGAGITAAVVVARTLAVRNYSTLPVVIKLEGCEAGFQTLDGALPGQSTRYYPWVDGVMPPQVTGWNAGDWFKIPDWSFVLVQPNGAEPTAFGPSTLACRQDDPNASNYEDCWGRKLEPLWSTPRPDGNGATDWRYERDPEYQCGSSIPWWKIWTPEWWQP